LDFQKQFLLFVVSALGFFVWALAAVAEKKVAIIRTPLHFFVAAITAVAFISSLFSLYRYGSLWGAPLPVSESFISALSLALFYLLIVNNFKKEESYKLLAVVAVSATLAAVYGVIQSLGFYLLPFFEYTKSTSFNTIGTVNGLVLFSAVVLAAIFPLLFAQKNPYRVLMSVSAAVLFSAMVFFNNALTVYFPSKAAGVNYDFSLVPWMVLAFGALFAFIFSISDSRFVGKGGKAKSALFVLMLVSVSFAVFNIFARERMYESVSASQDSKVVEAVLRQEVAIDITLSVLRQSFPSFFFGSGPGTFAYDYVRFKPQFANQDSVSWNLTFFSGSSEVINRAATTGLLGVAVFLLMIGAWTVAGFRALTGEKEESALPLAVFSGWTAIVVASFCYPFNLSLAMLFWAFLGLVILAGGNLSAFSLNSKRSSYAASLVFVVIMVLGLGLLAWNIKRYYAEAQFLAAAKAMQNNDLDGAIKGLESAVGYTGRTQDNYLVGLSQMYLMRGQVELKKEGVKAEEAFAAARPYFLNALDVAALSTDFANPGNSANWVNRGYIYRQLLGFEEGFDSRALEMYQKALALEPNNPLLWTEIGQVYGIKKDVGKAKESFNKAISLRGQYIDPHYDLALIFDQEGDKKSAIRELEIIATLLPADDSESREKVAKAIQNLKDGNSLTGPAESIQPSAGGEIPSGVPAQDAPQAAPVPGEMPSGGKMEPGPEVDGFEIADPAGAASGQREAGPQP